MIKKLCFAYVLFLQFNFNISSSSYNLHTFANGSFPSHIPINLKKNGYENFKKHNNYRLLKNVPTAPSKIEKVQKSSESQPICGSLSYDPDTSICCNANKIVKIINGRNVCCGSVAYNVNEKTCCNSVLSTKIVGQDFCCGSKMYDDTKHHCCNGKLFPITGKNWNWGCCNRKMINQEKQSCCQGKIFRKKRPYELCCGELPFDPTISQCKASKKG